MNIKVDTSKGPNVIETTFNNIGDGFKGILDSLEKINQKGTMDVKDTLKLQHSLFQFNLYQETVTKIASKSANAINEVMKSQ